GNNGARVHLIGLLTEGSVHASFAHLEALVQYAKNAGVKNLSLHLFTDGKDSAPRSAPMLLKKISAVLEREGVGEIASIGGRFYGMDRDEHYDRTKKAYDAMTGKGPATDNAEAWVEKNYGSGLEDEFITPASVNPDAGIKEGDAVICFNFREDSMRQIGEAFMLPGFNQFPVIAQEKLSVATFTAYSPKFSAPVAFPQEIVKEPLGKTLADKGLVQIRIAETEKYAHVTYFFDGLATVTFPNEYRILVPSQNVARHDEHPEMMADEIARRAAQAVEEGGSDFILVNFANPDIVAHTGNLEATKVAITAVDRGMARILDACLKRDAVLIMTADHGNAERLRNPLTGVTETKHDASPVPVAIVGKEFASVKTDAEVGASETEIAGLLSDVAPTILHILGIPRPDEMTGENLIPNLR
ncbi:MAG: 2,3-bisphosphoglycerate-independent phosphoglycerate mutase, partial [Candidatus Harrisonbacteria bacterium]|nr:2,3-bisphosphoglycerate-independent phosphoglycerate mutase [Candidatus Harrisonbacteria bacterium]